MKEPIWLELREIVLVHQETLAEHGGLEGLRDEAMLESALARPKNLYSYSEQSLTLEELAASYGFGIARNHPFVDGNKRTALVASFMFLELNGLEVQAPQEEIYLVFTDLAAGRLTEKRLADWLQRHSGPVKS